MKKDEGLKAEHSGNENVTLVDFTVKQPSARAHYNWQHFSVSKMPKQIESFVVAFWAGFGGFGFDREELLGRL
jgi:hypothetical protein